jgi:hypothetical protein
MAPSLNDEPPVQPWSGRSQALSIAAMAWNGNGTRRPRRRHGDAPSPAVRPVQQPDRGGARNLPGADDQWEALSRELDRSRRYRHPLTLVRMVGDGSSGRRSLAARARREGRPRRGRADGSAAELLAQLRGLLRSGDCAWCDADAVFVLLPETDASGAEAMVARARAIVPALAAATELRLASFPQHALTAQGLRAAVAPPRAARFGPAGTAIGDREWRALADRLPGRNTGSAADPMPEGAD